MRSLRKSAISGVKWTTGSTLVVSLLSLFQLAVLARLLRPSEFGLMAMAMVVIGFAQTYADMGISAAIVHRQSISREHLSSLYWLNICAGSVVFVLVCALSPLAVLFFHEPLLYRLLPLAAVSFLVASAGQQFSWLLEKDLSFNALAKIEVSAGAAGTMTAVVAALLGQGVWSLVWGQLTSAAAKTLLLIRAGWRRWPPMLHFRRNDLRGYLGFGLYQMGERSINYFNYRVDQLLVGNLLGAQELGYYNFAFSLVMLPVSSINPVLTRVAFPVFARIQDDVPGLRQSYLKMMSLLSTVNAPLLFGLAAVAPLVIPLFFGPQWIPAVLLVQVLAVYAFVRSTGNPVGSLLLAKGRVDLGFRWNLALLFTTAPVVYAGSRLGGAAGIAVALVLLILCYAVANYFFLVRALVGPCAKPYSIAILKPATLATAMGGIVLSMSLAGGQSVTWLAAEVAAGAAVYMTLLWFSDRALVFEVKEMLLGAGS
ncbi:MAG: colanic acid undecaprenyl disphosphate flippase WzxC [Thermodesulfovibrionales bacterium]